VVTGDHVWRVGTAPPEPRLRELIAWLSANHREDIVATDSLCSVFPPAQAYADTASGLLAVSISKVHASYILWFRPEVVQTVKWGGDPTKPVEDGPGPARLHPRKSFEVWKEIVRHRSAPWKPSEIGTVKELRNAILGIVLRKAEELALLSESVREHHAGLQSLRSMRRIEARRRKASALQLRFSQSLASRRQRFSQAMVRSTIQRFGRTTNPFA